jgi:hypothetical protein
MGLFDRFKSKKPEEGKPEEGKSEKPIKINRELTKDDLGWGNKIIIDMKALPRLYGLDYDGAYKLHCDNCGTQFDSNTVRQVIVSASIRSGYGSMISSGGSGQDVLSSLQATAILAGKCPVCMHRNMVVEMHY